MGLPVAISELDLKGYARCRLDWIGAVHWDQMEPLLEVLVSPLDGSGRNQRRNIPIGVGQWPALRLGTIWEHGREVEGAAIGETRAFDVEISEDLVRTIEATATDEAGKRIIPPKDYGLFVEDENFEPGGKGGAGSKCLAITYKGDRFGLILPMAEAIRWYYARSTDLAKSAIWGDYKHDLGKLINIENSAFDENARRCVLHLKNNIANEDAWTIGRVLQSPVALHGVSRISDSLKLKVEEKSDPRFPECGLPFVGPARWTVRGIWVGEKPRQRFLILQILRCTAPFPFEEMEVSRDADAQAKAALDGTEPEMSEAVVKVPKKSSDSELKLQSQKTPAGDVSPMQIELGIGGFSFLEGKDIIRNEKQTPKEKAAGKAKIHAVEVNCLSTSDGCGQGEGAASAEMTQKVEQAKRERRSGLSANVDMHAEIIAELNKMDGVQAARCMEVDECVPSCNLARRGRPWELLEDGNLRRVGVIEVLAKGARFYFLEIEQPEGESGLAARLLSALDGGPLERGQLERIVGRLTRNRGRVPKGGFAGEGVGCVSLNHTWGSAGACAGRIFDTLKKQSVRHRCAPHSNREGS